MPHTASSYAWMLKPWTCPKCGKHFAMSAGAGTHRKYCDPLRDVEAFWAKVQRGAPDACWPFMGARVPSGGYGRAWLNKKLVAAHRIAYMCAKGNIPEGLDVMHSCDNPPCCNPAHLKAATTLENMQDCMAKGRGAYPGNKLDEAQAREILSLKGVMRAEDVADKYELSLSSVHNIWTGRAWKSIRVAA